MTNDLNLKKYSGFWVAIVDKDEKVAAWAKSPEGLIELLEEQSLSTEEVSILLVPDEDETHHIL